jgi:hypothetical protein
MLFSARNGLKEDAPVDIPNTFTMSQAILISSLFTLLIGWLIIFAYLALRPIPKKQAAGQTEQTTALPAIVSPVRQPLPIAPRGSGIPSIPQQTPRVTISADSKREMALDRSRH